MKAPTCSPVLLCLGGALLLASCMTMTDDVMTEEDFAEAERGPHGVLRVELNYIPYTTLWSDNVEMARYYEYTDTYHFNPSRSDSSQHTKYKPPYVPDRHFDPRLESWYTPRVMRHDAGSLGKYVEVYFATYDGFTPESESPGDHFYRSARGETPALLVYFRNLETGKVAGDVNVFYATNRGNEIVSDEDFKFLMEHESHEIFWRPSRNLVEIPLPPGEYELRYRLLVYRVGNVDRRQDEDGNTKPLGVLGSMLSHNDEYMTGCFVDEHHTVQIRNGDILSLTLEDITEGMRLAKTN
ncbi:MAG: hypothetical protein ACOCWU_01620 [Spirochaetota bacterium]